MNINKNTISREKEVLIRYIDQMINDSVKSFEKNFLEFKDFHYNSIHSNVKKCAFYNKSLPNISVKDYLTRVVKHTKMEFSTLMLTCIYLERYFMQNDICLVYNIIHR